MTSTNATLPVPSPVNTSAKLEKLNPGAEYNRISSGWRYQLFAFWAITRPGNVAITAASVAVAAVISSSDWMTLSGSLILAMLSVALIAAGGNVFNDYCDRDLDRIQKPHRPIPAGLMTPRLALIWAAICFVLGIILSTIIGLSAFLVALGATLMLLLYSWRWKRMPLIGNLAVAFIAGLAFIYGGIAVKAVGAACWAAWLAFLFHLGREIVKDLEDHLGDSLARANTLVVRYGPAAGRYAVSFIFLTLACSLPLPYIFGGFTQAYLVSVAIGVFPVLVVIGLLVWRWSKTAQLHRLSVILKWDMIVGLVALYLGRPPAGQGF